MVAATGAIVAGSPAAGQDAATEVCVDVGVRFRWFGGPVTSVTIPIEAVDGLVESITVEVEDENHPSSGPQTSERVTIALGAQTVGTTPDLDDDVTEASLTLAVGATLAFDTVTITHAPDVGPDSITVRQLCVAIASPPSSTTVAPATTSSTTSVPASTSSTSTTTSTPAEPSSTTTTTTTTTVPPQVPGSGSFVADCATVGAPAEAALVWAARGTLPSAVSVGTPIALTEQVWSVTIPGALFDNALALDLIADGDEVGVVIGGTIAADNTEEGERSATGLVGAAPVVIGDDGSARPATGTVAAPDMVFTPTASPVTVRLAAATLDLDLGLAEPVQLACVFDDTPPHVTSPPPDVSPPEPPELAITGPGTYLWAGIVVFVLLDVGYLAWSATRPRRRAVA